MALPHTRQSNERSWGRGFVCCASWGGGWEQLSIRFVFWKKVCGKSASAGKKRKALKILLFFKISLWLRDIVATLGVRTNWPCGVPRCPSRAANDFILPGYTDNTNGPHSPCWPSSIRPDQTESRFIYNKWPLRHHVIAAWTPSHTHKMVK